MAEFLGSLMGGGGYGGAAELNQLPDFLRFNRYGGVLTQDERKQVAKIRGVCVTCGRRTHKVTPFRTVALENKDVRAGVCLHCHPEEKGLGNSIGMSVMSNSSIKVPRQQQQYGGASTPNAQPQPTQQPNFFSQGIVKSKIVRPTCFTGNSTRIIKSQGGDALSDSKILRERKRKTKLELKMKRMAQAHQETGMTTIPQILLSKSDLLVDSSDSEDDSIDSNYSASTDHRSSSSFNQQHYDFSASSCDAWDVVKDMRNHPDDIDVLTRKCHELRSIGTNQAGSLYEVIDVMRRFPDNPNLQFAGIGALWSLSADGVDDRKSEAIEAGAAAVILDVLAAFPRDANLVSWGMGALSSLGEGMGSRADLQDEGDVVEVIQEVMKIYGNIDARGRNIRVEGVLYWVFRCLAMLVYEYDEEENYGVDDSFDDRRSLASMDRDTQAMYKYTNAFFSTTIAHSVLVALSTIPMDAITMEWGLKFLAHLPLEDCEDDEAEELMAISSIAISRGAKTSFPTLHSLACAISCNGMSRRASLCATPSCAGMFFNFAVDCLASNDGDNDAELRNVMLCTVSHALIFGNLSLAFKECKKLIKICFALMEKEKSSIFVQETCCCVIHYILSYAPPAFKTKEVASKACNVISRTIAQNRENNNFIAVALGPLSEAALIQDCGLDTVDVVMKVLIGLPASDLLHERTCRFFHNICKSKDDASYIESKGGLLVAKSSLESESLSRKREAINLMYKLSKFFKSHQFPLANLEAMLKAQSHFSSDRYLAAKSLHILATSVDPNDKNFLQVANLALESIKNVMASFPNDAILQKVACLKLIKISTLAQKSNTPLDISIAIRPVLDAQHRIGPPIHKDASDAIWAMMGVKCELGPELLDDLVLSMIEVMAIYIGSSSSGRSFRGDIVTAALAVFTDVFAEPAKAIDILGMHTVERIVDLVLTVIYSCLDRHGNHPFVFSFGFSVLKRLCDDVTCQDIIVRYGGIVAVIDGMTANGDNPSIQEKGCNILRRLANFHLEFKLSIVESDGVDVIINMMMSHSTHEPMMREACHTLSFLCVDKQTRTFIAQQGGIILLANAVENLPDCISVQEQALGALCSLSSDADIDILETFNVFEVVKKTLDHHLEVAVVQRRGLALLRNLSLRGDRVKRKILSSGCLDNCTKAMKYHSSSSKIVESSLSMLLSLMGTDTCQKVLLERGTIKMIIDVMMMNVQSQRVQMLGCTLLCALCQDAHSRVQIFDACGLEAIVYAMLFHCSSETVQDYGCRAISCFSLDPLMTSCNEDLNVKMVESIVLAMDHFPDSVKVQENAVIALRNIATYQENIDLFRSQTPRIKSALFEAMVRFPEECSMRVKDALGQLT